MMPFGSWSGFLTATQRFASPSVGEGVMIATHEEGLRRLVLPTRAVSSPCWASTSATTLQDSTPGPRPWCVWVGWWPWAQPPSYHWAAEAALDAGATADVVGTLIAVAPISGLARVISGTSEVALAIGYDLDQAFEGLRGD